MSFVNLHCHSHFSLLDGLSKADQIATRCATLGQTSCAITDHGSISGAVTFMTECKKKNIKPIVGCEVYITDGQASFKDQQLNKVSHQIILAKNLKGWYKLIKLVSRSNDKDVFYYKPRIDVDILSEICNNDLISFSGHPGSSLAYRLDNMSDAENYILLMKHIFGPENFFIEIQSIECKENISKLRELAIKTNTKCIATGDSHYADPKDNVDHTVLLCSSLGLTLPKVKKNISMGLDVPLSTFFKSTQFHIPSYEDVLSWGNTEEEINNTTLVADMCENYDITGPPKLPHFICPDNMTEKDYLKKLCLEGWRAKNKGWGDQYKEQARHELDVINGANLAGYFLIVQDYVNWCKNQGWLIGAGRGSGAGSLISYLLNITSIDPIPYDLLFERFYNAGRNTADRVSLPDIDVDFPVMKRKQVIDYIKNKYGNEHVCQMVTFGRMMGKGALKEVLRIHEVCDFDTMNKITKEIPEEGHISDQLEESGETSILRWTLQNDPDVLSDWCRMNDDETLTGDYAQYFAQAIRLEGTYKSQGKHPAGIIISADKLDDVCPMINDKNNDEKIAGMNMNDMESMGHTKFDILGVACLDKLMGVQNLLRTGKVEI